MPSETFFRLPESKQERIMQAIKDEIARVPYEQFSVGNVIKECDISRGSFYQYFANKEDIYLYLISDYQKLIIQIITEKLQTNGGDIFDAVWQAYRHAVRMLCYKDPRTFRFNLFCNLHLFDTVWQQDGSMQERIQNFDLFKDFISTDCLTIKTEDEIRTLYSILISTALKDVAYIFITEDTEQQVLERYQAKMDLMKKGFYKEPNA